MASVLTALLIETVAALGISASLAVWARKRFTPRDAVTARETATPQV